MNCNIPGTKVEGGGRPGTLGLGEFLGRLYSGQAKTSLRSMAGAVKSGEWRRKKREVDIIACISAPILCEPLNEGDQEKPSRALGVLELFGPSFVSLRKPHGGLARAR